MPHFEISKIYLMKKVILSVFVLSLIALFISCGDDNNTTPDECDGVVATYNTTVKGILNASCAINGCHASVAPSAGLDLTSYTKAKASSTDPKFICTINHGAGCNPMPQGLPKLSDAFIKILTCWVKNGSPE